MRARLALAAGALIVAAVAPVAPAAPAGADPANQAISMAHVMYIPANVTIVAPTIVTWTNNESNYHSVTSDTGVFDSSPTNCVHGGATSGCIPGGGTYQYTFNTPGTYAYSCRIHADMHGTVQVVAYMPGVSVVGVSPNAILRGSARTMTVTGQGFTAGATVSFSGTGITVRSITFFSAQTLTAKVAVTPTAAPGGRDVTVTDPGGGGSGTCTACFTVSTPPTPPTPTSTSPSSEPQGTNGAIVLLGGSGFQSGAIASAGQPEFSVDRTDFISSTQLQLTVTVANNATPGLDTIFVTNPDTGIGSCACFTVTAASAVTATGVSPGVLGAAGLRVITVTGTGFASGATVSISGSNVYVGVASVQNSTTLTVTVRADRRAILGSRDVTVTDSAGAGTCFRCLTIDAAPFLRSASPNMLPRGTSNATVNIYGTGFVSGAVASIPNGTGIVDVTSTVFVSSTQLTLTVNVASNAPTGGYDIKVVNPDAGLGRCMRCLTVT